MQDYAYRCRVCGLEQETEPWSGNRGQIPSFEICSCCGVEFGVEDEGLEAVVQHRKQWLENGLEWFNPDERPDDWDIDDQLARIPPAYRFSPVIESVTAFRDLYENGELSLLKRARVAPSVWESMLREDFEKFAPLAAEATSLVSRIEELLLNSENREVFERLRERNDLDIRPKAKQRISEVLER